MYPALRYDTAPGFLRESPKTMATNILHLPSGCIHDVVSYLAPSDLTSFLRTNRQLYSMNSSLVFWKLLLSIHFPFSVPREFRDSSSAREWYLLQSQLDNPTTVRWNRVDDQQAAAPSAREGHLACRIGDYMILTGGFTDDDRIHYKHVDSNASVPWTAISPVRSGGDAPSWVYGATLTTIDDSRAVRFGGFRAGGYSHEVAEVRHSSLSEALSISQTLCLFL